MKQLKLNAIICATNGQLYKIIGYGHKRRYHPELMSRHMEEQPSSLKVYKDIVRGFYGDIRYTDFFIYGQIQDGSRKEFKLDINLTPC